MSDSTILLHDVACGNVLNVVRRTERATDFLLDQTTQYVKQSLLDTAPIQSPEMSETGLLYEDFLWLYWKFGGVCGKVPASLVLSSILVPLTEKKRSLR